MEVNFDRFIPDPHNNREGFANVRINDKLEFLYVVSRDKETGDLKAFPPAQRSGEGYLKCYKLPFETAKKIEELVISKVFKILENDKSHVNDEPDF